MIDNIGRGGLTNNIMTYVNKSRIEITRIMIAIRKTLMMTLMVAATAMMISILFCRWDKKSPRMKPWALFAIFTRVTSLYSCYMRMHSF